MGQLYHWNDNNKSSERLINCQHATMNIFEQLLIITFISEYKKKIIIIIHRDLKWILTFIDNESSNNYEMFHSNALYS